MGNFTPELYFILTLFIGISFENVILAHSLPQTGQEGMLLHSSPRIFSGQTPTDNPDSYTWNTTYRNKPEKETNTMSTKKSPSSSSTSLPSFPLFHFTSLEGSSNFLTNPRWHNQHWELSHRLVAAATIILSTNPWNMLREDLTSWSN